MPTNAESREILATATMISMYEMFDADNASTSGDWEQHLSGKPPKYPVGAMPTIRLVSSRQRTRHHCPETAVYYYETLQYLSQTLLYPPYAESREILATATMISMYVAF
jgi:hypothetical protein